MNVLDCIYDLCDKGEGQIYTKLGFLIILTYYFLWIVIPTPFTLLLEDIHIWYNICLISLNVFRSQERSLISGMAFELKVKVKVLKFWLYFL